MNNPSRRQFIGSTMAAAAAGTMLGALESLAAEKPAATNAPAQPVAPKRKIKLGVVGLGLRGNPLTGWFRQHGGYDIHAVADYFPEVAVGRGQAHGVDKSRCFSGLSGYKKVIESGIEAILLETPPYFFPEHAAAAVEAGLHVYMAKPVAVDVPGALSILASGKAAAQKQRVFFVDYQLPTDPRNIEVAKRIHDGGLGKLAHIQTVGFQNPMADPAREATIAYQLHNEVWCHHLPLGGGYLVNYDIHAIDAALWIIGQRPIAAAGSSRISRPNAHSDAHDVCSVVYEYADGLVHNHFGQTLHNINDNAIFAHLHGTSANAMVNYFGKSYLRGGSKQYGGGNVDNVYVLGSQWNIAAFYTNITSGQYENVTVPRAVDGVLTCILGRDAAARHCRLTMEELLKENKKITADLTGLKA